MSSSFINFCSSLLVALFLINGCIAQISLNSDMAKCDILPDDAFCTSWSGQAFATKLIFTDDSGNSSISQFDSFTRSMLDISNSANANTSIELLRGSWGCPNWNGTGVRYLGTGSCGLFAYYFSPYCGTLLPICKEQCYAFLNSVTAIFNDSKQCDQTINRTSYYASLEAICQNNATECAPPIKTEQTMCGFSDSSSATTYCNSHTADSCCKSETSSTQENSGLPVGAIVGIVVGVIACLLLIALLSYGVTTISKRRKQKLESLEYNSQTAYARNSEYAGGQSPTVNITIPDLYNTNSTKEVWQIFEPTNADEIQLNVGDTVDVSQLFSDNWAWGLNLNTQKEGAFPYLCVKDLGTQAGYANHPVEARTTSLYGAQ